MDLKTQYKDTAIAKLDGLIDTEYTIARCFEHLAVLIRNGRVKNKFTAYADVAKKNKDIFAAILRHLGAPEGMSAEKCALCKIDPESFSLNGALNLGLEVMDIALRYYEDLISLCEEAGDRKIFKRMLKEKARQKELLKRERKFEHPAEGKKDPIDSCGISDVVARLYK